MTLTAIDPSRWTGMPIAPSSDTTSMNVLDADSLSVSFDDAPVLHDASLLLRAGTSVSVVGSSGSGKSTLLHCLAGLRLPTSGSVSFDGQDIVQLSDRERSAIRLAKMGIVFQFGELVPELSILENVALPAWLTGESRRSANSAALTLLQAFGIEHTADRHPGRVSGGERQRAAVARAIVHQPAVVFADEPTGSLDSDNADRVIDTLLDETRQRGVALVLVTHERRLAERADVVVTMRDGRITTHGSQP
ncbi:ATP-binding cassette domain-containing protein [Ilumatobacter sp.]|uniref:ABC transporter ATP-binding protein n=1 Tax=Ilumatobacter sp. TaxID=1967498 RepID=UPI003750DAD5